MRVEGLTPSRSYAFIDGSGPGEGRTSFTLTNRGPKPITIQGVERNCVCLEVEDLRGRVLGPGQSCEFAVRLEPPETGVRAQKASVHHDGPASPLELSVEASGRRRPPYVIGTSRQQVVFLGLDGPGRAESLTVTTCEPVGSPPWLGGIICDLPEIRAESRGVREQHAGAAVVRVYEYRIGWHHLPPGREFFGTLHAATVAGMIGPEVARIAGTTAAARTTP